MYLSAAQTATWPEAIIYLGVLFAAIVLIASGMAAFIELRKTKLLAKQEDALRQLVRRYEQLAENTLDAQQRTAADVAELRSRTASVEQILRTVDRAATTRQHVGSLLGHPVMWSRQARGAVSSTPDVEVRRTDPGIGSQPPVRLPGHESGHWSRLDALTYSYMGI